MFLDYGEILRKAFKYTKNNRSLWFFGFILVFFGGGTGFSFPSFDLNLPSNIFKKEGVTRGIPFPKVFSKINPSTLFTVIIAGAIVLICIWLLALFVQHFSRGALIEMVDDIDNSKGTSIKSGFKSGFLYALPLIGIIFIISAPVIAAVFAFGIVLAGISFVLIIIKKRILAVIIAIFGVLFLAFLIIVLAVIVGIINMLASRFYVITETKMISSIKEACLLFKDNIGSTLLIWLINVVIGIGQGIIILIVTLLLFLVLGVFNVLPIVILATKINVWLYALLIVPVVIIMCVVSFIGGLFQSFLSAYWTLAFKSLIKAN